MITPTNSVQELKMNNTIRTSSINLPNIRQYKT